MQNQKFISLTFVIEGGYIKTITSANPGADAQYIKTLIDCAHSDIKNNQLLSDTPAAIDARSVPPGDKIINDVNYILSGGNFANLPSEDY
jgi:hypothetical protein